MPGFAALNASATFSSTSTCSGASPVPRQQYQRISTSPGLAAEPVFGIAVSPGVGAADSVPSDDAGAVDADEPGAATDAEGVVLLLQAATTRMAAAKRAPRRLSSLSISLLLPVAVGGRPARLMDEFLLLV